MFPQQPSVHRGCNMTTMLKPCCITLHPLCAFCCQVNMKSFRHHLKCLCALLCSCGCVHVSFKISLSFGYTESYRLQRRVQQLVTKLICSVCSVLGDCSQQQKQRDTRLHSGQSTSITFHTKWHHSHTHFLTIII